MISVAHESDFPNTATNEVLVRICGLRLTYGKDTPFIHYYSDGEGSLLAIMDGVGLFYADELNDEWSAFLAMNPDLHAIHCSKSIGEALMKTEQWHGRVGDVMRYSGEIPSGIDDIVCTTPHLPTVYSLLKDHFPGISPFNSWYPDVSHRIRHGNSHISAIMDGENVISTTITVAETDDAAILGQVATHPDFRCRGLAGKCIKSTISQCKDKALYILPVDEIAKKLYAKLGFDTVDGWAELERTH